MAIVLTIAIVSYALYVYIKPPTSGGVYLYCFTHRFFNLYCVGCGMTRFVYYLMHFDIIMAMQYNFFGFLILLMLMVIYIYYIRWSFFDARIPNVPVWLAWAFLVFVVVYSVCRNLPFESFSFLSPPN